MFHSIVPPAPSVGRSRLILKVGVRVEEILRRLEQIGICGQVRVAIGTQALVPVDEFGRLVVLAMTARAAHLAQNRR